MKFKEFTLDQFQEEAIKSIENNNSVVVSAPTGSGKTVIAEYIINDYGKQLDTLAESVLRRYMQLQGVNVDYPDELYHGTFRLYATG